MAGHARRLTDYLVNWYWRLRLLATGHAEWVDEETGDIEVAHESWRTRWALAGFHSYSWRWVRRWGGLPCGCTVNPLTRRRVLTRAWCPVHFGWEDDQPRPL